MGSTLVRPGHGDPMPHTLALVAGLAVLGAVRECLPDDPTLRLKWPNDLLAGTAKLAGVLLEAGGPSVVIGIGVNLVSAPELPDRAVTSLAALGGAIERNRFADLLSKAFDLELERWRTYGLEPLIARWCQAAHPEGTPLTVQSGQEPPLNGTFAGLNAEGALQLRLADGSVQTIHAGEVNLSDQDHAARH